MTDNKLPATLQERARARVQEALADIYTDEELDAMVRQEIDAFFSKPTENFTVSSKRRKSENWNSLTVDYFTEATECKLSPFQLIVWNMCATMVLNKIVETSHDPKVGITTTFTTIVNDNGAQTPLEVKEMGEEIQRRAEQMAQENIGKMFAFMFSGMMEGSKQEMMNDFVARFGMPNY